MSMFADAYISTLGYQRSLAPGVSEVRESFDVFLFFGEQRHKKGGDDRKGDET